MEFDSRLAALRKERGWSQEKLAEMVGVSRQAVSKWESGQSVPELDKLVTLSEVFGVSIDSMVKDNHFDTATAGQQCDRRVLRSRGSYEYKSKRMVLGVPLVHVNTGGGMNVAKGIIAIGDVSIGVISLGGLAVGVLSLGGIAVGVLSLGGLALGLLLALGGLAVGTFALGGGAVGVFAWGGFALGVCAAGGGAVASHIAVGDHAIGHIAIGNRVEGVATLLTDGGDPIMQVQAERVMELVRQEFPQLVDFFKAWVEMLFR